MRETHEPLESVGERLVRAVQEGSKRPSKSLKGSKLRRTSNLTFSKTFSNYILENHRIRDKYVQKYFYTFRINQIIFTYVERKKKRPNFYRMFSQNLPISATFTAILKTKLPGNAKQSECAHRLDGYHNCGSLRDIPEPWFLK